MKRLVATIVALTLLGSGCSGGKSPEDLQQTFVEIRAANKAGNFQKGYDLTTEAIEKYPARYDLLERRSHIQEALKNYDGMIADATEAMKKAPADAKYRLLGLQATGLSAKGQYDEAEKLFAEATAAIPTNADKNRAEEIWRFRGRNLLASNRAKDALASYTEALKLKPDSVRALSARIICYGKMGDKESFASEYAALKKKHPKVVPFLDKALKAEGLKP